jgi:rod shape determining protein RodA
LATILQNPTIEKRLTALKRFDIWLLISAVLLLAVGLLSLYSVDAASPGGQYFRKQLFRVLVGAVPFAVFFFVDPRVWRRYANVLYIANVVLLALVLLKGKSGGGAQRWIQFGPLDFQPSELAKLFVILTLAAFLMTRLNQIRSFSTFLLSLAHVAVPLLLVFKQPHLGAALVILVAWLSVSMAAGIRLRFLLGTLVLMMVGLTVAMRVPGVLKDYQRERVKALLNPSSRGNAYQPLRAQIAFGVGGLMGTGYMKGEQKEGHYIPEQQNDFIFTVIGEEGGLFGCTLVLLTYAFFFYRIWLAMIQADDPYYKMVISGIFGILVFHTIVNLGMNLQLLPVVGLWLPFMSYGGTAMWLCMACVALLLNIRGRQRPALF